MDRDEFMELVYETFADEPDNVLANGIIEAADAYVEHEKAQLSQEGTTSDLISRQAAIDALDCINGVEEVLRSLPTIQPELTDEQVIDYCRKKGYKIVADDLFDLLSKSEPQWIPVSERLPESGTYCLFTVFEHDSELEATTIETVYGCFHDYGERRYWSWEDEVGKCCIEGEEQLDGYHDEIIEKVLAWMPLPTPYTK